MLKIILDNNNKHWYVILLTDIYPLNSFKIISNQSIKSN